jgi:3-dehydroquinate dehydratase/shikimate dehydrogenase
MAKICLCLTAKTINRNLEILEKYRKFTDIAELRVDCLDPDESLLLRHFPKLAGLPVILTIRRDIDGGYFAGGEGARIKLFAQGLAYAEADMRLNFAYVDIEDDLDVPSLEEAARAFGTRIIRSCHSIDGPIDNLPEKIRSMYHIGDEIVKVAVKIKSTADVLQMYYASKTCPNKDKILIGMGHYGICTRLLAEQFNSFLTYSCALAEQEAPGAFGQFDVQDLSELYRFRKITKKTKIYGIIGNPLKATISPLFFNTVFKREELDAVYVQIPADSITEAMNLAEELKVFGLSVTVPYKEAVLPYLIKSSKAVQSAGSCNTVLRTNDGWVGENTDGIGFIDSLLNFLGKKKLKRLKVTIIGAGGAARSIASEIAGQGCKTLILNRTVQRARDIALKYKFRWHILDNAGIELINQYNDLIIQATSVGMEGHEEADPLEVYNFTGKEVVMDLIYQPEMTLFLKHAAAAGCRTINGYNMVIRQAYKQYEHFLGKEIPKMMIPDNYRK